MYTTGKKFNAEEKVTMETIYISNKGFLFEIIQEYKGILL